MQTPRIIVNSVSFRLEHTQLAFNNVSLAFEDLNYGIVGDNGVGKTTLLKLISGELLPNQGSIQCLGSFVVVPQSHSRLMHTTSIADVLGISDYLSALKAIHDGSCDIKHYEKVADHWDIENRITQALKYYALWPIDLNTPFSHLSGGQKTKLLLAKTLIFPTDFILFDEPTNNLDTNARDTFYQFIENSPSSLIIVSHDRRLLNKMDRIIEITTKGFHVFGGNYDFYRQQKDIELQALQQNHNDAQRAIALSKKSIQKTRESHEQSASRGKKAYRLGKVDKLTAFSKKGRSEKTKSRMATQEERILTEKQSTLNTIKAKIESTTEINFNLDATAVANNKIVLDIENLCFDYKNSQNPLLNNINIKIIGPQRISLQGPNGCGKSTLIKLIRHQLQPSSGNIKVGVECMAYFDQEVSILDNRLTLIENYLKYNPGSKAFDAYSALATFTFRNKQAEKRAAELSGGERMRAGLAISLLSKQPPQLIILDEPTNHLDLASISALEQALQAYQGAVLAVSHDTCFLEGIGIDKSIALK